MWFLKNHHYRWNVNDGLTMDKATAQFLDKSNCALLEILFRKTAPVLTSLGWSRLGGKSKKGRWFEFLRRFKIITAQIEVVHFCTRRGWWSLYINPCVISYRTISSTFHLNVQMYKNLRWKLTLLIIMLMRFVLWLPVGETPWHTWQFPVKVILLMRTSNLMTQ